MKRVLLAAIVAATVSSGCASLTNNTRQPIVVSTTCGDQPVQGASCRIINAHGSWTVASTPGSVMISKAPSDMAIDCRMPQAQAMPVLVESHATTGAWGNLLVGGLLGFGVDAYRDAAWKYDSDFVVDMCKGVPVKLTQAMDGAPMAAASRSPEGRMETVVPGDQKYAFTAESMAKQRMCTSSPHAVLNARGPATEVYTVACNNGDALMLKCVYGDCKAI